MGGGVLVEIGYKEGYVFVLVLLYGVVLDVIISIINGSINYMKYLLDFLLYWV